MGGYYGLTSKYRRRGMTHRKIALALSVLLVCVNLGLSHFSVVALADGFAGDESSVSGNDDTSPLIVIPGSSVSDNSFSNPDPNPTEDSSVSDNESEPEETEEIIPEEEASDEDVPSEDISEEETDETDLPEEEIPEETTEEETPEETPAEVPHAEPEPIANTEYQAVAYEEIAEYFLEPRIGQVDRDADYVDGVYYAHPNGCYYFFLENETNYLVCRYDGGQEYISVKNGKAVWNIPGDLSGRVSFGYEGTEGTFRELFSDLIFHDTTAPAVVLGMDETYQSQLRVEISEVGDAKSGIAEVTCSVDGKEVSLENYAEIQKSIWRGSQVALMGIGTLRHTAGIHEVTLKVTDNCGNLSEVTEEVEFLTNGIISVSLPSTFMLPMMYDYENRNYVIMDNQLNVINNGDCPLDVKITNVTVSVDKTLPSDWKGGDPSAALAAAARKAVDTTMSVESRESGQSSRHLKEGLNSEVLSFMLDAKKDGESGNVATISFAGATVQGDPSLWESGDFVVHMTFMFSLHLDPKAETVITDGEAPLSTTPALVPEIENGASEPAPSESALVPMSDSVSENDLFTSGKTVEEPPDGSFGNLGGSGPKNADLGA